MDDSYGYFSEKGNEYVVTTPETPRHWFNYLWNDDYITFISQVGYGEKLCMAVENTIELASGESEEIHFILGIETSESEIKTS